MRARSGGVCCAGSITTAATFPGGEPAIPITSWCRSSCCSRPRSRGSRDSTTGFWRATPPWSTSRQPLRLPCARAGRAWATIDGRSTCTGWPRKSSNTEEASFPRTLASCAFCRGSGGTPPRRSRALLSSARSRRSIPTWPGCFAGYSIPEPHRRLGLDGSSDPLRCSCRGVAGKPGHSIRQLWSWER
jgi:hypothetical protein